MNYAVRATEQMAVVDGIVSVPGTAGTLLSGAVNMATYRRFLAVLNAGIPASGGTITAKWRWSATSGGTYADVTGSVLVTDTVGSLIHQLEVTSEQVQAANPTARYLKLSVTTATAAVPFSATIHGMDGASLPVSNGALAGQTITAMS